MSSGRLIVFMVDGGFRCKVAEISTSNIPVLGELQIIGVIGDFVVLQLKMFARIFRNRTDVHEFIKFKGFF